MLKAMMQKTKYLALVLVTLAAAVIFWFQWNGMLFTYEPFSGPTNSKAESIKLGLFVKEIGLDQYKEIVAEAWIERQHSETTFYLCGMEFYSHRSVKDDCYLCVDYKRQAILDRKVTDWPTYDSDAMGFLNRTAFIRLQQCDVDVKKIKLLTERGTTTSQ